jgi:hypothetical protein
MEFQSMNIYLKRKRFLKQEQILFEDHITKIRIIFIYILINVSI